ncbi:DUF2213 domain-containing protein [Serratia fonticola]|uniref:DUF2213 domain-containing protein n=1 Tax=Serratia fonticola TaxID=47917 RepID=A0AAW3WXC2_SERFO|nr:DUF2213 domain-containing protein [Serratia fonticola]MBC3214242.1 DUF2213 domain-containing protein [Serratia fonticola]NYA13633.1 DUF2213 domain-containing protein [Serratia fonticola]NYA35093.1 DUF2213 domain-containing protein [Serratia fonticola]
MRITLHDRQSFPINTQRIIAENGYLLVPGRVARTGVQQYLASELGLTDRPPNSIVNVYRPPEEVFSPASLASYDNTDVTVEHPDDLVDSTTFKEVSVGHAVSPGRPDEDDENYVVVDYLIKAQEAIDSINRGKAELSAGYTSEYVERPGVAPDGTPYEFVQTNITINHTALCDQARAGRRARLFDHKPTEKQPMPKVTLDNGVKVEVADEATQTLIQTTLDSLKKRVKDAEEEAQKAKEEKEAAEAKADAKDDEIEELKEKASEDAISSRLADVISAMDSAVKIAGKEFTSDSVNPLTIKRQALDAAGIKCKKHASWDKAPDAYVTAYFDAEEERKEIEDEEEDDERQEAKDSVQRLGGELGKKVKLGDAEAQRQATRQAFLDKRYGRNQEGKK